MGWILDLALGQWTAHIAKLHIRLDSPRRSRAKGSLPCQRIGNCLTVKNHLFVSLLDQGPTSLRQPTGSPGRKSFGLLKTEDR